MVNGLVPEKSISRKAEATTATITLVGVSYRLSHPSLGDYYLLCIKLGRDSIISALHWGPLPEVDAFWKTSGQHQIRRTDYSNAYHTFGLEWSEDYLFTYIDSRLLVRGLSTARR